MSEDTGVSNLSNCLYGKRIIFAVSGGIAATESIKISRELRRHGAIVHPIMTKSAEKVVTPLALSWGSGLEVISDWEPKMSQLGRFDGLLLAPATRNTISKFIHGIIDSPAMMALSSSSGNDTPMMFVPSMHDDLFDDRVTGEHLQSLENLGIFSYFDESKEGRRKQPDPVSIVANFSNLLNSRLPNRKRVVVTLGANRSPIDSIRFVQNTSTGKTGWSIAEHLHMMGHSVVCIAGQTTLDSKFQLPDVRFDQTPNGMLETLTQLALSANKPEVWIHAAAVLDYVPETVSGKHPSGDGNWQINLKPSKKHIAELSQHVKGSIRVGFKLEVGTEETLVQRSLDLISQHDLDAVVANLLDESNGDGKIRCRFIYPDGEVKPIPDMKNLCEFLDNFISNGLTD